MSERPKRDWKRKAHEIIFEADTPAGKAFDIVILLLIVISVITLMLGTVEGLNTRYARLINISEWVVTGLFSAEYLARIIVLKKPSQYIFSFWGVIDFLATIPKYLAIFFVGATYLSVLRALRLVRVFRILDLAPYIGESHNLTAALKASKAKILVFLVAVISLSIVLGTVMYWVEGPEHGFTSIPKSVYWTIVTMTTVGYGDIAPETGTGQLIASIVMILGYGIIAVPTGIVSAEYTHNLKNPKHPTNTQSCPNCSADHHRDDAYFCYSCGEPLGK
ncbi:MAG TPA: ion transporter [Saprospiraceae bacterium]|nr:ion transporter [Saprospiraceae bacterium]